MADQGLLVEDLPRILREEYLYAIEMARALHDPASDWDGFRETLWSYLLRVFGVDLATLGDELELTSPITDEVGL